MDRPRAEPRRDSASRESRDADEPSGRLRDDAGGSDAVDLDSGGSGESGSSPRRVHVRRLGVLDTLRWSRVTLSDRPALVGVAFAANLPSVVAAFGVSRPAPSASPAFADWTLPMYLLQMAGVAVAAGAFSLTAADAVDDAPASDPRPLRVRVGGAVRRLPAVVGTTLVAALLGMLSLLPAVVATLAEQPLLGLVLVAPAGYVAVRLLLAYQACVIDRYGPIDSVRAGWRAAGGIVRKVFAVGVVYVLAGSASDWVSGLFGGTYDPVSTLASAALSAVLLPFFGLALAHLYLESSRNQ